MCYETNSSTTDTQYERNRRTKRKRLGFDGSIRVLPLHDMRSEHQNRLSLYISVFHLSVCFTALLSNGLVRFHCFFQSLTLPHSRSLTVFLSMPHSLCLSFFLSQLSSKEQRIPGGGGNPKRFALRFVLHPKNFLKYYVRNHSYYCAEEKEVGEFAILIETSTYLLEDHMGIVRRV